MKNKKGFTITELLVSFVLLAIVITYLLKATISIITRENDLLMLQEYNVFESTLLNKFYEDIEGLTDISVDTTNPNEINFKVGNNGSVYKNITFSEEGIYYDNVLYELPNNVKLNNKNYYTAGKKNYIEGNYIKNFIIVKIPVVLNKEDKEIILIIQNADETKQTIVPETQYICKRASTLHTETCTQTDTTKYCSGAGYANGATITYGNLGTSGTLSSGDAFDCDVNGDGTHDSTTERFYYVTDLEGNSNVAVLIYYNNVSGGEANNTSAGLIAYDSSNENWHGPVTAITNLPTKSQWRNVRLTNSVRTITNENGGNTTKGVNTLPSNFSYEGYAARLLTYQEMTRACGTDGITTIGYLDNCNYLMENTKYSSSDMGTTGYWLENARASDSILAWIVDGDYRNVGSSNVSYSGLFGVRPAIEVLKTDISY